MIEYPIFYALFFLISSIFGALCYHHGCIPTGCSFIYPSIVILIPIGLIILDIYLKCYYDRKNKKHRSYYIYMNLFP